MKFRIQITDHLIARLKVPTVNEIFTPTLATVILCSTPPVYGVSHVFSPNTGVSSSKVNQNFSELQTAIDNMKNATCAAGQYLQGFSNGSPICRTLPGASGSGTGETGACSATTLNMNQLCPAAGGSICSSFILPATGAFTSSYPVNAGTAAEVRPFVVNCLGHGNVTGNLQCINGTWTSISCSYVGGTGD